MVPKGTFLYYNYLIIDDEILLKRKKNIKKAPEEHYLCK